MFFELVLGTVILVIKKMFKKFLLEVKRTGKTLSMTFCFCTVNDVAMLSWPVPNKSLKCVLFSFKIGEKSLVGI